MLQETSVGNVAQSGLLQTCLQFSAEPIDLKTSKVVGVRAKAKMQNILSRKSLEKTKQI